MQSTMTNVVRVNAWKYHIVEDGAIVATYVRDARHPSGWRRVEGK